MTADFILGETEIGEVESLRTLEWQASTMVFEEKVYGCRNFRNLF